MVKTFCSGIYLQVMIVMCFKKHLLTSNIWRWSFISGWQRFWWCFPPKCNYDSTYQIKVKCTGNAAINVTGLLRFRAVADPRISSKSAKSREIHQNTRNPAKLATNLTKYMSAQYIWKLSWLLGLLTCCKHTNCADAEQSALEIRTGFFFFFFFFFMVVANCNASFYWLHTCTL